LTRFAGGGTDQDQQKAWIAKRIQPGVQPLNQRALSAGFQDFILTERMNRANNSTFVASS
jgi:hypothetical protein